MSIGNIFFSLTAPPFVGYDKLKFKNDEGKERKAMRLDKNLPHLPIWGDSTRIPGNTGESKSDVMHIDKSLTMEDVFTRYPGIWDKSTPELGDLKGNDYLVWFEEMAHGYGEESYSDVPQLIPFPAEGSDRCVILCPGGAYLTKSMLSEGQEVAEFLNAAGISAFVLWYRSYPYRAPLMYLDAQRAVRYVRYHAADWGVDPGKIALAGFSAGGNLAGVEALCFRNEPVDWPGYVSDEIDAVDGNPNALGLVYPAISMHGDKIVAVIAGRDVYEDAERREAFADRYDLRTHVQKGDLPMFLCACADDDVVPPPFLLELAGECMKQGVPCETHLFPYGGHGFGACIPHQMGPFPPADFSACRQWRELFVQWMKQVF